MNSEKLLDLNDTPTFYLHPDNWEKKILCPASIVVNMEMDPIQLDDDETEADKIPAIGHCQYFPEMEIMQRDGQFWRHFDTRDYRMTQAPATNPDISFHRELVFHSTEFQQFDPVVFKFYRLNRELGHRVGGFLKFYGMAEGLNTFSNGSSALRNIKPRYPVQAEDLLEAIANTAKLVVAPLDEGVWPAFEYDAPRNSGTMSGRSAIICYELYLHSFTLLNLLSNLSMQIVKDQTIGSPRINMYRAQALYCAIKDMVEIAAAELANLPSLIGKRSAEVGTETHST